MPPFQVRERGEVTVLTIDDPAVVNDGNSDGNRRAIHQVMDMKVSPRLAVDLGPIDFLSSSGIAFLIGLRRRADAAGGSLALFNVRPYVLDLLRVMRLDRIFRIADREDEAVEAVRPAPTD